MFVLDGMCARVCVSILDAEPSIRYMYYVYREIFRVENPIKYKLLFLSSSAICAREEDEK